MQRPVPTTAELVQLIEDLRQIRLRVSMYVGDQDVMAVHHFLTGLTTGLHLGGFVPITWKDWRAEAAKRGWGTFELPIHQMRKKGWSDTAIIDELFEIQIAAIMPPTESDDCQRECKSS